MSATTATTRAAGIGTTGTGTTGTGTTGIGPDGAGAAGTAAPSPARRYGGVAQALHWITAAALFLMLPFVWVAENFPPGDTRTLWYLLHESTGISIFLLVLLRLTWRRAGASGPSPRSSRSPSR